MDINKLVKEGKCILAIKSAERASLYLQEDAYKDLIHNAIKFCWEWMDTYRNNFGDTLYTFLDNEEDGFTVFQEMEKDEKKVHAWDCIIDAIAYVSRAAYEKDGIKFFPEPIEIVDDHILDHMIQSLILCDSNEKRCIEKVYGELLKAQSQILGE